MRGTSTFALLALLAGCQSAMRVAPGGGDPLAGPTVVVSGSRTAPGADPVAAERLTLQDSALYVYGRWQVTGSHVQRVLLYAPDGSLFSVIESAFQGTGQPAWVEAAQPIATSGIRESEVTGEWRAHVALDGRPATEATFHLARK